MSYEAPDTHRLYPRRAPVVRRLVSPTVLWLLLLGDVAFELWRRFSWLFWGG